MKKKASKEQLLEVGKALFFGLKSTHEKIKVAASCFIRDVEDLGEKEYDRRIWEQMTWYCAKKAGVPMVDINTLYSGDKKKDEIN